MKAKLRQALKRVKPPSRKLFLELYEAAVCEDCGDPIGDLCLDAKRPLQTLSIRRRCLECQHTRMIENITENQKCKRKKAKEKRQKEKLEREKSNNNKNPNNPTGCDAKSLPDQPIRTPAFLITPITYRGLQKLPPAKFARRVDQILRSYFRII